MARKQFPHRPDMVENAVNEAVSHIHKSGLAVLEDRESSPYGSVYLKVLKPFFPVFTTKPVWVDTPHTIRISDHPPSHFPRAYSVHPGSDRDFVDIWNDISRQLAARRNKARAERARAREDADRKYKRIANLKKKGRRTYGTVNNAN